MALEFPYQSFPSIRKLLLLLLYTLVSDISSLGIRTCILQMVSIVCEERQDVGGMHFVPAGSMLELTRPFSWRIRLFAHWPRSGKNEYFSQNLVVMQREPSCCCQSHCMFSIPRYLFYNTMISQLPQTNNSLNKASGGADDQEMYNRVLYTRVHLFVRRRSFYETLFIMLPLTSKPSKHIACACVYLCVLFCFVFRESGSRSDWMKTHNG